MEDMQHAGGDDAFEICLDGLEGCISRDRLETGIKHHRCISSQLQLTHSRICLVRSFTDFVVRHGLQRQVDENAFFRLITQRVVIIPYRPIFPIGKGQVSKQSRFAPASSAQIQKKLLLLHYYHTCIVSCAQQYISRFITVHCHELS